MSRISTTLLLFFFSLFAYAGDMDVKVYKGTSRYNSDVICTVRDGKVFKKTSVYQSDVVCSVRKDQVFKGNSPYRSDILYTIRDGKVYKGTSVYFSDIRFSFDGPLTLEEFVAVWHTVLYVY